MRNKDTRLIGNFGKNTSIFIFTFMVIGSLTFGQNERRGRQEDANRKKPGYFQTDVPAQEYNIILSRPTDHQVTISLVANENLKGYFEYGKNPKALTQKTEMQTFEVDKKKEIILGNLERNTHYFYRLVYHKNGNQEEKKSDVHFFQTQRNPGTQFSFTIQADSHLDENADTKIYTRTLQNMAADSADFLIDLGDTWMTDKYRNDYKESIKQYIAQRYYFGLVCHSSPLFLVLGNHDGESAREMANWAIATREKYYSNPSPDGFFSGNMEKTENGSYKENYYSWEWGNALFMVLDPFRYTPDNRDPWQRSLGSEQYNWLKNTLQKSKAKLRFVLIHNLVGGADNNGIARGGIEAARFFEWGGLNADSTKGFSSHRPGWEKPIHDLLVQYKVSAVIHGHDHVFVKQNMDGIIYQVLPQPGSQRYGNTNSATEYGYKSGIIMNAPGYLRVTVKGNTAKVDYVQTSIDAEHKNGEILHSYQISAN
ncbi:MAG: metallophosphoesterase [Prolixibacteraceae bacterium]